MKLRQFIRETLLKRQIERFYLVFGGHIFFETLVTAVRLDLFSLLAKHRALTRTQIAETLGLEEQPTRILLLGLTSLGLIRKKGDRYRNRKLSEILLVRESPENVISFILLQHYVMYKAMHHLYDAVKENRNVGLSEFEGTEPTIYGRLAHYPQLEKIFQDAMKALSVQANSALVNYVDFSKVKHLVDVGGGDGTNIIAVARKYPALRATSFDLAPACEIAKATIAAQGLSERLDAIPGDCFVDEFPKDADCILFAHFFTIWSEEKNRMLLKKCYDALPKGGSVVIFNMMQSNDEKGPLGAAIGSPYFLALATGEGMLYTWKEYETWIKEAGFKTVKKHILPIDHGAIVGIK